MLIAIILCLFSVAHSVPYFIRVDPPAELAPIAAPISETPSLGAPPPPPPPPPSQSQCCATGQSCCLSESSLSIGASTVNAQNAGPFYTFGNSGNFQGFVFPIPSGYVYNRLRYIPNQAFYSPYYRNYFYVGSQGSYSPSNQQEFGAPVLVPNPLQPINALQLTGKTLPVLNMPGLGSGIALPSMGDFISSIPNFGSIPELPNFGSFFAPFLKPLSLSGNSQKLQGNDQNLNPQFINQAYSQQLPVLVVPYSANIETPVSNPVPNPLQPTVYSQQLLSESVPDVRNANTPVASNVGIRSQISGTRGVNGFLSSGLVGALAAGGRSTLINK